MPIINKSIVITIAKPQTISEGNRSTIPVLI